MPFEVIKTNRPIKKVVCRRHTPARRAREHTVNHKGESRSRYQETEVPFDLGCMIISHHT